jgi:hypothetical protein
MEIFKESHTTKVIKKAHRYRKLSVCKYGSGHLITDNTWIIEVPQHINKIKGALMGIIEVPQHINKIKGALMGMDCLPEENEEYAAGPGRVSTKAIISLYEQIQRQGPD